MKKIDPDKPLTKKEWKKLGPIMYGIEELPLDAKKAVKRAMRGRPTLENPKEKITLRLDADLVTTLRSSGKGWQTRVNNALRQSFLSG